MPIPAKLYIFSDNVMRLHINVQTRCSDMHMPNVLKEVPHLFVLFSGGTRNSTIDQNDVKLIGWSTFYCSMARHICLEDGIIYMCKVIKGNNTIFLLILTCMRIS